MRELITATGMKKLNAYLSENKDIKVIHPDIDYQEELFSILATADPDVLLILDKLPGPFNKRELFEELIKLNKKMKIIFMLKEDEDTAFIKFLKKNGIKDTVSVNDDFDIDEYLLPKILFEDPTKQEVKEIIEQKDLAVEEEIKKNKVKVVIKTKVLRQQIITFYTTDNNLMKDTILTNMAVLLAKKSDHKILVIDMNTPTPSLDHFFGISKEIMVEDIYNSASVDSGLSACYASMEKKIFNTELLKEFVTPFKNYKNLDVLTGIYDLDLVGKMEVSHYGKLIESAADIYDTVIISVNPFWENAATYTAIMKSTKVIVTCDANWTNARNTRTIIKKEYVDNQNVSVDKFELIITNNTDGSLDKDVLKKIFEEFKILGFIPYNKNYEKCLNKKKPFVTSMYAKKDSLVYLDILTKLGYIPSISLTDKLFNRKKLIKSIEEEGE